MIRSSGISKTEDSLHSGEYPGSAVSFYFAFISCCLFVVAYGFQHAHMAMTQKEPGPSKKSIVSQCQACQAYTYNSIRVSWRLSRL